MSTPGHGGNFMSKTLQNAIKRLRVIEPVELMNFLSLLGWSFALLLPGATFENNKAYSNFTLVSEHEGDWAVVDLTLAAIVMLSWVLLWFSKPIHRFMRSAVLLLSIAWWSGVALGFLFSDYHSTGAYVYFSLAISCMYTYWIIAPNHSRRGDD